MVVSSSNLYKFYWELISQVIWFQDFFPKSSEAKTCEFEIYLKEYVERLCPKGYTKEVFRQKIDISKYDFSTAIVKLIGSINGRYTGEDLNKFGIKRVESITRTYFDKHVPTRITFQTSSLGRLNPKFLGNFYKSAAGGSLPINKQITDHIRIVFPTEDYVRDSHLGVEMADSVIL